MLTVISIVLIVALIFGVGAYIFSNEGEPKNRAADAAGAAAGGAMMAGSCLIQLIVLGIMALIGLWLLGAISG